VRRNDEAPNDRHEIIPYRRASILCNGRAAGRIAALLGGFLIWGVGFSHIDMVHNAAHDARHSAAFPCHSAVR
jgi:cobalt transporter subunit CbtB